MVFKNFNTECNQCSPVQKDYDRVVNIDDEGNEYITYVEVDYPKIQQSHGSVSDWSLDALLKAGINPNFSIHTGLNTRLEGASTVSQFESSAEEILSQLNLDENKEK